ncbi:hypothetical protein B5S32_g3488 [[Candida] boidinii]|nr:hypothetical protein B5S29_g624 [[Candida] boidinii]OWB79273.1 hypothetical protein B5S32_g3488 [[Candida] boidinii]
MSRPSTSATANLRGNTTASASIALNSPSFTTPTSVRVIDYDTFANYHSSSTPIQSDSLFPLFTYDRLDMPNTDLTVINIDSGYCASDTATIYSYSSTSVTSTSTNDNYNYNENIPYYQTFENKFSGNGDPHQHPEKNTDIHKNNNSINNNNNNNNNNSNSLTSPFSSTVYHDSSFSCSSIYSDESKREVSPVNGRNRLMNSSLSSVSSISSASDINTINSSEIKLENQVFTISSSLPQGKRIKIPKAQLNNSISPKVHNNRQNNNIVNEIYDFIPVECHFGKLPSYGDITCKESGSPEKNNSNGNIFDPFRDSMPIISSPSFKKTKLPLVKMEGNTTKDISPPIYIDSTCKPTSGKHKADEEPSQRKYKKRKLKLIGGKFKKDKEHCETGLFPIQNGASITESEKNSKGLNDKLSLATRTNVVKCPLTPHLKSTINIPLSEITDERLTQIINLTKLKKCSPREVEKMVTIFKLRNIHIKLRILAHIIGETNLMSEGNLHFPDIEQDAGVCLFDGNDGNLYLRAKTYAGFEKGKEQMFDNSIMSYFQNIKDCEHYFRVPNETTITLKQVARKNKYSKKKTETAKSKDDTKGNTIRFNTNNKEKFVANIKNDTTSEEVKYIKRPLNSFMLYRTSMVRAAILLNLCNCMTRFLQKEIVRCGDIVKYDFSTKRYRLSKIPTGLNYYPRRDYDPIAERLLLENIEAKLNCPDIEQRQEVIESIRMQLQHSKVNHHVLLHIISSMWQTETSFSKGKFQELSNLEKEIHSLCYPNYRYIPNKKSKK